MSKKSALSIVLLAHHPFTGICPERDTPKTGFFPGDLPFFEALSQTYLPLLELFFRLERGGLPFRLGMAFSPVFCSMLADERLMSGYLDYLDRKLEFGRKELDRCSPELRFLAKRYYEEDTERRIFFTEHCEKDIPGMFRRFEKLGRIEIMTTAASYAFLPLYASVPEILSSQIETAVMSHRRVFGKAPRGFWLPEFGWSEELEHPLAAYGFGYTMVDARAMILGNPPAKKGVFYPVQSPSGFVFLGRDSRSKTDLAALLDSERSQVYQKHFTDSGFELSLKALRPFLGAEGLRCSTGYRYHNAGRGKERTLYDPEKAAGQAAEHGRLFLDSRLSLLDEAGRYMDEAPLSLCAFDADSFGRRWYEGPAFLEALLEGAVRSKKIDLVSPKDYLDGKTSFQVTAPAFSSWAEGGYAATWLDASSDWMYRHIFRSIKRMIELTERFPGDSGLKERALNQAAREILLSQGSDWPKMLCMDIRPGYARNQIEETLRNFTTIFESLGSNYISTEWLTGLEKRHNVFPFINYRIFSRKR